MSAKPAISVLMPVYNSAAYLKEAVDSILSQSFGDFELLLVDDGSTDASRDIIAQYKDERIRPFFRQHEGLIGVLNFALAQAASDLVARMDSDDVSLPERFRSQLDFLRGHPEVVVTGGGAQPIDASGRPAGAPMIPPADHDRLMSRLLGKEPGPALCHPSVMMRRQAAVGCGGYRSAFPVCEDWDLWVRLGRIGRLHSIPEVVLLLRKHSGNVTLTRLATNLESSVRARVCHEVWRLTGTDPLDDAPQAWQFAERRIRELMDRHDLAGAFNARFQLKGGQHAKVSLPGVVLRLLARPRLFRGLLSFRTRARIIQAVAEETAAMVRATKDAGKGQG